MTNTLTWFELFVTDLERAQTFYETVLGVKLKTETFGGEPQAMFPAEGQAGALVVRKGRAPSREGALVYFDCGKALDAVIGRVEKAGGKVLMPKTDIGNPGHIAVIADSEGNAVGLHGPR